MRKAIILFAAAALTSGHEALADDLSYSYLRVDLQGAELSGDFGIISGAGHAVRGSVEIGKYLYAFGDYGNTRYAGYGVKVRFLPVEYGLGGHVSVASGIDLFGGVSAERLKIKTGVVGSPWNEGTSETFRGWAVNVGMRGWLGESFQWTAGVKYRDLRELESMYSVSVGGYYCFRRAWAVGMDYVYQKYDNKVLFARDSLGSFNVRYTFGGY